MNNNNAYQNTLDYIYSFINFSLTRNLRYSEEKFNLSRMKDLMSLVGNPHLNYDVIHVTGTKGKGSTCALIASVLREAGFKVGFYSSPHMIDLRERIKINDLEITEREFIDSLESFKEAIENVKDISTFEIITGLAFRYFSQKEIDIAVIEVGMGGRLDATNIVEPLISVITPISLDHTKILGDTVRKIAIEKAGIIKEGIPVVVSSQHDDAMDMICEIAENKKSIVIKTGSKYEWEQIKYSLFNQSFKIIEKGIDDSNILSFQIPLIGDHQIDNALTAFSTIKTLGKEYAVSNDAIQKGFQNVKWPGRFEVISEKPLIIIDGAHNPDSFQKLSATIQKYLPGKYISLVFGASEDKNIREMIQIIKPYIQEIVFTKSEHPRALTGEEMHSELKNIIEDFRFSEIDKVSSEMMESDDKTYIVAGSIFVASAIKEIFGKMN